MYPIQATPNFASPRGADAPSSGREELECAERFENSLEHPLDGLLSNLPHDAEEL